MLNWLKKIFDIERTSTEAEQMSNNSPGHDTQVTDRQGNQKVIKETTSHTASTISTENLTNNPSPIQDVRSEIYISQKSTIGTSVPTVILADYKYPNSTLLNEPIVNPDIDVEELEQNKMRLVNILNTFGASIQSITATIGPTETQYEIVPAIGIRIAKIVNLKEDIGLALNASGINIIAPIPGKGTIGISIPNSVRQTVYMRSLIESDLFHTNTMSLPIALGKKSDNTDYIADLVTLPHLLLAGATGQGKSVAINAIILSLLYKKHPSEMKFVMIDTKQVELIAYENLCNHFLAKLPSTRDAVVTDVPTAISTLKALCVEMDSRYDLLKSAGVRNIKDYNEKFSKNQLDAQQDHNYLPFIILIIDEFGDLITRSGREVEPSLTRLAQISRAVGIHMIVSTQHPSSEVITGNIKANFLGRIAFKVTSKINSRTILDVSGAETLLGNGDMLISIDNELQRVQCAFVSGAEVQKVVDFVTKQPGYPTPYLLPDNDTDDRSSATVDLIHRDKLFNDCARLVVQIQLGSTSSIQRHFNIGYNRAGRIMDQLERAGIVGPGYGSKPRVVYFKTELELEKFLRSQG